MRSAMIVILICSIVSAYSQEKGIDWSKSRMWKLYEIRNDRAFSYTIDTLKNFKNVSLSSTMPQEYLAAVELWPKEKTSVWMGFYVATCELEDNVIRKVDISVYGGFFYDEKTKRYYQVPLAKRKEWLEYWSEQLDKLSKLKY